MTTLGLESYSRFIGASPIRDRLSTMDSMVSERGRSISMSSDLRVVHIEDVMRMSSVRWALFLLRMMTSSRVSTGRIVVTGIVLVARFLVMTRRLCAIRRILMMRVMLSYCCGFIVSTCRSMVVVRVRSMRLLRLRLLICAWLGLYGNCQYLSEQLR